MVRMRASTFLCTVCGLLEQGGVTLPDDTHGIRESRSSSAGWRYHSGVCLVCRRTKSNLQTYKCFYCVKIGRTPRYGSSSRTNRPFSTASTSSAPTFKLARTATGDICDECVGSYGRRQAWLVLGIGVIGAGGLLPLFLFLSDRALLQSLWWILVLCALVSGAWALRRFADPVTERVGDSLLIKQQPRATGPGKYFTRHVFHRASSDM
jgi:hypothetical protein